MSLKKLFTAAALLFCAAGFTFADTLQLKDKAAVSGKILAEKSDAYVVDVGYTVLVIPHNAVLRILKNSDTNAPVVVNNSAGQFYSATTKVSAARDVSSLVKQLGVAQ